METEHKQINIQYGEMAAEVDEGIAPLILEMWKADIMTFMSCENNNNEYNNLGDVMWVLIDEFDVSPFLNCIFGEGDRVGLYYRAKMETESEDDWMYDVLIDDLSLVIRNDEIDYDGPTGITDLGRNGDPSRAFFDLFRFAADGSDIFERSTAVQA